MLLEIILAIIPIAWLIISMAGLKMAGYKSCGIGLVIAIVEGVAVYHMTVPEAIDPLGSLQRLYHCVVQQSALQSPNLIQLLHCLYFSLRQADKTARKSCLTFLPAEYRRGYKK